MNGPFNRSVVLVCDDVRLLRLLAAELRELGCRVFIARDLGEVAQLVRARMTKRFVLVRLGDEPISATAVCEAIAERLPGWSIQGGEPDDAVLREARADRHLVN
jgi:hypothetical protein